MAFRSFAATGNGEGDRRLTAVVGDGEAAGVKVQLLEGVSGATVFLAQAGPLANDGVAGVLVRAAPGVLEPIGRSITEELGKIG